MMISVAIDGPAGAGKSTIAKIVSQRLGFIYVDTGAMYRAIALACLKSRADITSEQEVISRLPEIHIEIKFMGGEQKVMLDGEDVSSEIRAEKVSMAASSVSAIPQVRTYLLELQRSFARSYNVIMDGRDIGTVVLPDAAVKIFLTAAPESRAHRRKLQLEEKGVQADYNRILEDIIKRDYNDTHRETAPLKPAQDSFVVDTSELTLEESVEKIIEIIKENCDEI